MKRYLLKRKFLFVLTLAATLVFNVLALGETVLRQKLIDSVIALDTERVLHFAALIIAYAVLSGGAYVLANICQELFGVKIINDMRSAVFGGIMRKSRSDFEKVNSADYVSALMNDLGRIQRSYIGMLFMVILCISGMAVSALLMFWYQPLVALSAVLLAGLMAVIPIFFGKRLGKFEKAVSEKTSALTTYLTEVFSGFEVISSFGVKRHFKKRFEECSANLKTAEYREGGLSAFCDAFAQLLSSVAQNVILVMACYMVFNGKMSMGALVVFISLNTSFCSTLSMVLRGVPLIKSAKPIIDRVNAFADYKNEAQNGSVKPHFEECLEVKDLSFGYESGKQILKNASLCIKSGEKCALLGESGCGKTTLIRLLTGELESFEGDILYDGESLRNCDKNSVCSIASIIHQDVFLFDDTVKNNICLFDEFSDADFERALRQSGVSKFVSNLPGGAEYKVGERGAFLSGGQRQRIAIARALIRNTPFLILDEGTSALDAETARGIEGELLSLKDLTLLTITHNLRQSERYDKILNLSAGVLT